LTPVAVYVLVVVRSWVVWDVEVTVSLAVVVIVRLVVTPVTVLNCVNVDGTVVVPRVLVVR
jgi:hypothetical protein